MTFEEKNKIEEHDIIEEMEQEIDEIENENGEVDEDKLEEAMHPEEEIISKDDKCRDVLARTMADFDNFKKRTERDKSDMIFFLKQDIFKKILPRVDDLERIIKNTPDEMKDSALFEWIISLELKFKNDLENLWVKWFNSKWELVNSDMHDVMTTVTWQKEWVIFDEFEKWYMLGDKVLRHSKVVVWAGE